MGVWKTRTLVGIWRVRTAFMRFWMRRGFLGSVITRKACYILVNKTKLTVYVDLLSASWTFTRDWAFWKYWANSVGGEIPWQLSVRLQPGCFLLPLPSFTDKAERNENQSGFGEWAHSSAVNKTCAMGRQQQLLKIVTQKPCTFSWDHGALRTEPYIKGSMRKTTNILKDFNLKQEGLKRNWPLQTRPPGKVFYRHRDDLSLL